MEPDRLLELAAEMVYTLGGGPFQWDSLLEEVRESHREALADTPEWIDLMLYVEEKQMIQGVMFILILGDHVLMEKCPKKAKYFPGEWFLPGGWIEEGDLTPFYAMIREMGEELGCRPQDVKELPIVDATDTRGNTFLMRPFVIGRWEGTVPDFCLDKPETELAWISLRRASESPVPVIRATIAMARYGPTLEVSYE